MIDQQFFTSLIQIQTMKNTIKSMKTKAKHITLFMVTFLSFAYIVYSFKYMFPHHAFSSVQNPFNPPPKITTRENFLIPQNPNNKTSYESDSNNSNRTNDSNNSKTQVNHIVFGIGASKSLWHHRKEYIKLWWLPNVTRGYVWLDQLPAKSDSDDIYTLPPLRISGDTSSFKYTKKGGDRSAIRISRIVAETVRLGLDDVRWLVMGDDDTVFVVDNLVRVLQKYDHKGYYYIGSTSESHLQNIKFSYNMAFGGGGIAISYPLARELEKIQDECLHRYPGLYGSDDRIHACMAELGVPLTKEVGFHQFDMNGNVFGYLAAHPVAPLVSLHHLDRIEPVFPRVNQVEALKRLDVPMKLDSAALMQQSICYDMVRRWTISVSWGYAVQILCGIIPPRDMEKPELTFRNWYGTAQPDGFPFNTRPLGRDGCNTPHIFVLSNAVYNSSTNQTASEYVQSMGQHDQVCKWKTANPSLIHRVQVYKRPDPHLWDKSPRRNCCRVLSSQKEGTMEINVGECSDFTD